MKSRFSIRVTLDKRSLSIMRVGSQYESDLYQFCGVVHDVRDGIFAVRGLQETSKMSGLRERWVSEDLKPAPAQPDGAVLSVCGLRQRPTSPSMPDGRFASRCTPTPRPDGSSGGR